MKKKLKILVACEFSGVVRRAFRALGHDAWSCDLIPSEDDSEFHLIGDCRKLLKKKWDLVIFHPPCTALSNCANWHKNDQLPKRREQAIAFVKKLMEYKGAYCLENPKGSLTRATREPNQIIQPWQFGDPFSKATCLWLQGLPKLQIDPAWKAKGSRMVPSITGSMLERWVNQNDDGQNSPCKHLGRSAMQGKAAKEYKLTPAQRRSRTYEGIAHQMAHQWSHFLLTGRVLNIQEIPPYETVYQIPDRPLDGVDIFNRMEIFRHLCANATEQQWHEMKNILYDEHNKRFMNQFVASLNKLKIGLTSIK